MPGRQVGFFASNAGPAGPAGPAGAAGAPGAPGPPGPAGPGQTPISIVRNWNPADPTQLAPTPAGFSIAGGASLAAINRIWALPQLGGEDNQVMVFQRIEIYEVGAGGGDVTFNTTSATLDNLNVQNTMAQSHGGISNVALLSYSIGGVRTTVWVDVVQGAPSDIINLPDLIGVEKMWIDYQVVGLYFNPLGPWSNATAYAVADMVTLAGSSYFALVANTNVTPGTAPTVWDLL